MQEITVTTTQRTQFIDITRLIAAVVKQADVTEGHCLIFCPHTTAGVTINEHADPDVVYDISNMLGRLIPPYSNYRHQEGNADAHIKASLIGSSVQVIVQNGSLLLGTWQGIFLCEFDGPRQRRVWVSIK